MRLGDEIPSVFLPNIFLGRICCMSSNGVSSGFPVQEEVDILNHRLKNTFLPMSLIKRRRVFNFGFIETRERKFPFLLSSCRLMLQGDLFQITVLTSSAVCDVFLFHVCRHTIESASRNG